MRVFRTNVRGIPSTWERRVLGIDSFIYKTDTRGAPAEAFMGDSISLRHELWTERTVVAEAPPGRQGEQKRVSSVIGKGIKCDQCGTESRSEYRFDTRNHLKARRS